MTDFKEMVEEVGLQVVENNKYELIHLKNFYDISVNIYGGVVIKENHTEYGNSVVISIDEFFVLAKWFEENGITWDNVEDKIAEWRKKDYSDEQL